MLIVPLQEVPAQIVSVTLANQLCKLKVYQTRYGLFIDIYVNDALILGGVICQNLNRIVRDSYLGFVGDFLFLDNQGTNDPDYTGLGGRYSLCYLETTDLANIGVTG